jgi:hypothetical protein
VVVVGGDPGAGGTARRAGGTAYQPTAGLRTSEEDTAADERRQVRDMLTLGARKPLDADNRVAAEANAKSQRKHLQSSRRSSIADVHASAARVREAAAAARVATPADDQSEDSSDAEDVGAAGQRGRQIHHHREEAMNAVAGRLGDDGSGEKLVGYHDFRHMLGWQSGTDDSEFATLFGLLDPGGSGTVPVANLAQILGTRGVEADAI